MKLIRTCLQCKINSRSTAVSMHSTCCSSSGVTSFPAWRNKCTWSKLTTEFYIHLLQYSSQWKPHYHPIIVETPPLWFHCMEIMDANNQHSLAVLSYNGASVNSIVFISVFTPECWEWLWDILWCHLHDFLLHIVLVEYFLTWKTLNHALILAAKFEFRCLCNVHV